mgnify:CR=1 FL=1
MIALFPLLTNRNIEMPIIVAPRISARLFGSLRRFAMAFMGNDI